MNKYKTLIVDDEKPARILLERYTEKIAALDLVATCTNAIEAQQILSEQAIDILLLDIQMDEITGLELLRMLKNKPATILTTAYSEYALESYDLDVIDYLVKPIEFDRFLKAISKAMDVLKSQNRSSDSPKSTAEYMFIKVDHQMIKIAFDDLLYLENYADYVKVHTTNGMKLTLRTLTSFEENLAGFQFFRLHRSYIVNLDKINVIEEGAVKIGEVWIPISRRSKEHFLKAIKERGIF